MLGTRTDTGTDMDMHDTLERIVCDTMSPPLMRGWALRCEAQDGIHHKR